MSNYCQFHQCNKFLLQSYPFCNDLHLPMAAGVQVRQSKHKKVANHGLFATKPFTKGQIVTQYSSKIHDTLIEKDVGTHNYELKNKLLEDVSDYLLEVMHTNNTSRILLNSKSIFNYPGRYINDYSNDSNPPNVKFKNNPHQYKDMVFIDVIAIQNIQSGDELLTSYGNRYDF